MLSILILTLVPVMTTPEPQPPQPKQPIEIRNKECLTPEEKIRRKMEEKRVKDRQQQKKFSTSFLNKKTKVRIVQSRKPAEIRNGLASTDRAKRRMKDKNNKSSLHLF